MEKNLIIFYADDDADDLSLFRYALMSMDRDIELLTYDRGEKLLRALSQSYPVPHVIFLDLNMPEQTGFDVLEILKKSDIGKHIPIVIFSTSSESDAILKCKGLGASLYIPKPMSMKGIRKSIAHALDINWKRFAAGNGDFVYIA